MKAKYMNGEWKVSYDNGITWWGEICQCQQCKKIISKLIK